MNNSGPVRLWPLDSFKLSTALVLGLLTWQPAYAVGLRFENATIAAGGALIRDAASGSVDIAFSRAAELGRPGDAAFTNTLQDQWKSLAALRPSLGEVHGVSAIEESHFGGCLRHEYRVRYTGGDQHWILKWRRGSGGWYLADLAVRGTGI
ncbi:MAG: hypothetical protein ACT4QA_02335 [Panacagrimonas sp.]